MPRYEVEILRKDVPPEEALLMVVAVSTKASAEHVAIALSDEDCVTRIVTIPDRADGDS